MRKARYTITFGGMVDGLDENETDVEIEQVVRDSFKPDLIAGVSIDHKIIDVHFWDEK